VLGTYETSCIVIAGLLERDTFNLFLPEFDKPWVIHLRETYCCSTNLCTWRPVLSDAPLIGNGASHPVGNPKRKV
jgi:hypothetical protein